MEIIWMGGSEFNPCQSLNLLLCPIFLGLIFWVKFCSNSNTLTFDLKVYIWKRGSSVVRHLPMVLEVQVGSLLSTRKTSVSKHTFSSVICNDDARKYIVLPLGTLTGCPLCRESHPLCRLKNPKVI